MMRPNKLERLAVDCLKSLVQYLWELPRAYAVGHSLKGAPLHNLFPYSQISDQAEEACHGQRL
jgi:hypothetical protein